MSYEDVLAQFQRIELALAQAKMERAAAENRSSPISSLPSEILAHIFRMHRDLHDAIWADVTPPSIRISHVSGVWREIALSEPSLWTKLVASPAHSLDFYNTMILRSKQSQLAIAIEPKWPEYSRSAHALAELISSQSHRICTLRIRASFHFIQQHILSLRNISAPYLTHLQINNTSLDVRGAGNPLKDRIFTGGTGKRFLFESQNMPLQYHPPLTEIFKMALSPPGTINFAALHTTILEIPGTLDTLVLSIDVSEATLLPTKIMMPHLHKLWFTSLSPHTFRLLGMFQAPRLYMLNLFTSSPPPLQLDEGIAESYPKLRFLFLRGSLRSGMLTLFPTARELTIYHLTNIRDTFDPTQNSFLTIMPRLRSIIAPATFEEPIRAFCAHRQLLGLTVPEIKNISSL